MMAFTSLWHGCICKHDGGHGSLGADDDDDDD